MSQHALLHKDMPTNRNYKNQHNHQTNSWWNASTTQGNAPTISKRLPLSLPPSISSALRGQSAGKPIQAFVQTIASGCACGLDEPLAMTKVVKAKLLSHFCRGHCLWQVLSSVDITKCSWQMFMSLGQSTERHGHRRLVDLKHLKTYGWTERRMHLHCQYWFDQDVHTEIQQPVRTAGIITK